MKRFLIILGISLVLVGVIAFLTYLLRQERKEVRRLSENQRSLMEEVELYRTKDSLSAASVERLLLTKKEYEKYFSDQVKIIDNLNIKISRLQSVSETGTETMYPINIPVKDSVVIRDSMVMLKCLELHTPYLDVSGCIDMGRFSGKIISRDTLDQAVHRVPHRFWFIKWGTKAIRQDIVCRNPYSQITYSAYIELK